MSKVLHLTLKKKWFDMIASGDKKEEYREVKPYWFARLLWLHSDIELLESTCDELVNYAYKGETNDFLKLINAETAFFSKVIFRNGYAKNAPTMQVEFKGIEIGKARPEWSDNWQGEVFVIKLGNIINQGSQPTAE